MTKHILLLLSLTGVLISCSLNRKITSPSPVTNNNKPNNTVSEDFIYSLLKQYPQYFDSLLANNQQYQIQIIYTRIDRTKDNEAKLADYYFNTDSRQYFYPASTVKLPVALLALQKLNELNIPGLNRHTTMITESAFDGQTDVYNDPTAADGRPAIEHYIKKILLVSDNDAFNRLYEFLGQEYINNTLHKMDYENAEILHRLNIRLSEEQNRNTNPVKFFAANGKLLYEKPLVKSNLLYASRNNKLGRGYYEGSILKNEPFDFSKKNRLPLTELHTILKSIFFPEEVKKKQRFNISEKDRKFVQKYMSMIPAESKFPSYSLPEYKDAYVKFLLYGAGNARADTTIRIFNKVGDAYGFLIDAAYIVDFKNNIEFMLSAVIHCNSDGIYNDDKYDYEQTGFPFMKHLGQVFYEYELKRERKNHPDLSAIKFNYTQ